MAQKWGSPQLWGIWRYCEVLRHIFNPFAIFFFFIAFFPPLFFTSPCGSCCSVWASRVLRSDWSLLLSIRVPLVLLVSGLTHYVNTSSIPGRLGGGTDNTPFPRGGFFDTFCHVFTHFPRFLRGLILPNTCPSHFIFLSQLVLLDATRCTSLASSPCEGSFIPSSLYKPASLSRLKGHCAQVLPDLTDTAMMRTHISNIFPTADICS